MQNYATQLGLGIRDRRRLIGLSQTQLGQLSGVSRVAISELENGKGNPRLETLVSILHVLGLQIRVEPGQQKIQLP